jgi:hypothetical protein
MMRKLIWMLLIGSLVVTLSACGAEPAGNLVQADDPVLADGAVRVEIVSLDHAPIRPAVQDALAVAAEFGDKVTAQTYTFGTPAGDAFAKEHDLTEHTPLAIFVNGEMDFEVDGRSITFYSFPQGEGTGMVAEGVWTMADFRAVLVQETE